MSTVSGAQVGVASAAIMARTLDNRLILFSHTPAGELAQYSIDDPGQVMEAPAVVSLGFNDLLIAARGGDEVPYIRRIGGGFD